MRNMMVIGLSIGLGAILCGCVTNQPPRQGHEDPDAPAWWWDPHPDDVDHLYFKAKGEDPLALESARADALASIKRQIAERIQSTTSTANGSVDIVSRFDLRGVEVFKETPGVKQRTGRWAVYMLGRYPRAEYNKIVEKIERAQKLAKDWTAAQSEYNRDNLAAAEPMLLAIVKQYDQGLSPPFAVESVKLMLAGLYAKQKQFRMARKWTRDVRTSTANPAFRDQAESLERTFPEPGIGEAFGLRKVALFCCVKDAKPLRYSSELLEETAQRLSAEGVPVVKLTSSNPTLEADLFNGGTGGPLRALAAGMQAEVVLAVLLAVDPSKTGQKVDLPGGGQFDAYDATATYFVVRVSDGKILCTDKTVGYSQGSYAAASRSLCGVIFTHRNHLKRYVDTIADAFAGAP